jgi:hypothetical protein
VVKLAALLAVPTVFLNAPASPTFTFFTPGKIAMCAYYTTTVPEYLICAGARNPVTVTMPATGRPWVRAEVRSVNGSSSPAYGPILDYGMTWRGGASFRCVSLRRGLTCRNVVGHGFVLGRARGYRTF